jgi:hypothetical protein
MMVLNLSPKILRYFWPIAIDEVTLRDDDTGPSEGILKAGASADRIGRKIYRDNQM